MVLFNYSTRELTAKIVYYGPGLGGKTTNLQYIHANLPDNVKGRMLSLATKTDRTLFFDFLPIDLGDIRGMKTRVQLYTVPGQVFYNETRKLVLKGADGIVFVADSQEQMMGANVESFRNLEDNLKANGMRLQDMPHVIQFNKRDLPRLASIEDLNASINRYNAPFYESVATTGIGVQDTLKASVKLVLLHLTRKYDTRAEGTVVAPATERRPSTAPPQIAPPETAPTARAVPPIAAAPRVVPPVPAPPRAVAAAPRPRTPEVRSIPVSSFETPLDRTVPVPVAVVTRPAPAPAPVVPPPPDFRGTGARHAEEERLVFEEEEIEGLVDEVDEIAAPGTTADDVDWPASTLEQAARSPAQDHAPGSPPSETRFDRPADLHGPAGTALRQEPESRAATAPVGPSLVAPFAASGANEDVETSDVGDEARGAARRAPVSSGERRPRSGAPLPTEPEFEVDLGFDPAWREDEESGTVPARDPGEEAASDVILEPLPAEDREPDPAETAPSHAADGGPLPTPPPRVQPETADSGPVVLDEVAGPDELFADPDLEVARLASGDSREIVVPVEVSEGAGVRRFKLSIRLRLDPID